MLDWIKFTKNLTARPEVAGMSRLLGIDRHGIVGRLSDFWSWADSNTTDGTLPWVDEASVDELLHTPGFAAALIQVGWLQKSEQGLVLPRWERHNTASAKARALESEAKRLRRFSASLSDKCPTKEPQNVRPEEKRRESSTTTTTREPYGPVNRGCTLEEAFTFAERHNNGQGIATGIQIPRHAVTLWHDERTASGWVKVKGSHEMPIADWQADLRVFAQHYQRNELSGSSRPGPGQRAGKSPQPAGPVLSTPAKGGF